LTLDTDAVKMVVNVDGGHAVRPSVARFATMVSLRTRASAVRGVIIQWAMVYFLVAGLQVVGQPWAPLSSVVIAARTLLTPASWPYLILSSAALASSVVITARRHRLAASVSKGLVIDLVAILLEPLALGHLAVLSLCSAVLVRSYAGLLGCAYAALTESCSAGT
jgi:hypothetical protein